VHFPSSPKFAECPTLAVTPARPPRTGCNKEQYREKFGALPTYTLLTSPVRPALESGVVVAKVSVRAPAGQCVGLNHNPQS